MVHPITGFSQFSLCFFPFHSFNPWQILSHGSLSMGSMESIHPPKHPPIRLLIHEAAPSQWEAKASSRENPYFFFIQACVVTPLWLQIPSDARGCCWGSTLLQKTFASSHSLLISFSSSLKFLFCFSSFFPLLLLPLLLCFKHTQGSHHGYFVAIKTE